MALTGAACKIVSNGPIATWIVRSSEYSLHASAQFGFTACYGLFVCAQQEPQRADLLLLARKFSAKMEHEGEAAEQQQGWYSVWAQPSAAQEPPGLKPAMLHLSTLFQGPSFDPHVTVLGDHKLSLEHATFSLLSACRALAPFTCRLTQPACGNTFYQCVYMLVDQSPEVMHANKVMEGIFETSPHSDEQKTGYMPHLSLVYADLSTEEKEKAKAVVEEKFGPQLCDTEFLVSSLCLYSTDTSDKLLTTWKKVAEYPLKGQSC